MLWIRNLDKNKERIKSVFALIASILAIYCAIKFSKECSDGVLNGLSFCVTVLVPSLFIFMVIASYIANSRACEILSNILSVPTQKILHLPSVCSCAVLLSMIGGYPVGARCVSELYQNGSINKEHAQKLSMIAVCSGPGFVLNYIGNALLSNSVSGVILLISQFVAFVLTAIIGGRCIKVNKDYTTISVHKKNAGIIDAVYSGCKATVNMCAMVIVFSALISICDGLLQNSPILSDILVSLLEVTTACNKLCGRYPLYVISFIVGFGGMSVHFQVFSALKDIKINKALFFLFRIIQGILAGVTTYILLILFPQQSEVFSSVDKVQPNSASSLWGALALILTAVCFINSINNEKIIRR